jgi:hypothetical protein
MPTPRIPPLIRENPVEAARAAIWRLFEEGHIDDDMATTSLLAIDLGIRRMHQARLRARANGTHGAKLAPCAA